MNFATYGVIMIGGNERTNGCLGSEIRNILYIR